VFWPYTHSCANGSSRAAQHDPLLSRLSVECYVIVLDLLHFSPQHTPLVKLYHFMFLIFFHIINLLGNIYSQKLQSSLRGEARNVLTDTDFSEGGYDDTWLRIKAKYQNGKLLVFAAIAKMFDYKPIDGSLRQLRTSHDTVQNLMSILKESESCDPILFYYKKTSTAVSSCTGKFSGCTNENSNVRECANVY